MSMVSHSMKQPKVPSRAPRKSQAAGESTAGATHRSLERGLAVLESVANHERPVHLAPAETARRLGLHRSTAHPLMQSLVGLGYLRQDDSSRGYELTQKLNHLTGRLWTAEQLGEIAQPFLEQLSAADGRGHQCGRMGRRHRDDRRQARGDRTFQGGPGRGG